MKFLLTSGGINNKSIHDALVDMLGKPIAYSRMQGPAYAIDDQTANKVIDGAVEIVSEGHWKLFAP